MLAKSEERASYGDDRIIESALAILNKRLRQYGDCMSAPADVRSYLQLKLATLEHEVFCCLWLNSQHSLIEFNEMFRGTLTQTSVYPREVLKEAIAYNAAAVIFAHNHPSGSPDPSRADIQLTTDLQKILGLIDVKVLDHFIVTGEKSTSFAERGLL